MSLVVDARVRRDAFELAVAFTIEPGAVLAVLGANGAGKTTLLHAIAGLVPIDAGSIVCDGTVVDDGDRECALPEARPVGYVFQEQRLFPHLNALDNVAFGLRARGTAAASAREQASAELDAFGIAACAALRPGALSGGQAQRVALARTLVTRPRVVLLDEPFTAIDAAARPEVRAVAAARLQAIGGMTVLVTHDLAEAAAMTDDSIELVNGTVAGAGAPRPPR